MDMSSEHALMVMGHKRVPMRDFLIILDKSMGIINLACQEAGIGRRTYYDWRNRDQWFLAVSNQILEESRPVLQDIAKHGLIKKIIAGDTACIIFYLKTCHPEFRQNSPQKTEEKSVLTDESSYMPSLVETIRAMNQVLDEEGFMEDWEKPKTIEQSFL